MHACKWSILIFIFSVIVSNRFIRMDTAYYNRPVEAKLDKAPRRDPPTPRKEQVHTELRHPTTKQIDNYKKEGVLGDAVGARKRLENQ